VDDGANVTMRRNHLARARGMTGDLFRVYPLGRCEWSRCAICHVASSRMFTVGMLAVDEMIWRAP